MITTPSVTCTVDNRSIAYTVWVVTPDDQAATLYYGHDRDAAVNAAGDPAAIVVAQQGDRILFAVAAAIRADANRRPRLVAA